MKKLVIIHGVTGAIGSACLALFASQKDTVVYGISRRAKSIEEFLIDKKFPIATLICSIDNTSATREAYAFVNAIPAKEFTQITYIHAVGHYPFEIDEKGGHIVNCDYDNDGIDDRCDELTRHLFCAFYQQLSSITKKLKHTFLFGGIADKYRPTAHRSWWVTMNKTKEILKFYQGNHPESGCISLVNISSVICPNELITRPFVFSKTDNNPHFWLKPEEVPEFVGSIVDVDQVEKFKEYELFKKKPGFDPDYYKDEKFTPRKINELYK